MTYVNCHPSSSVMCVLLDFCVMYSMTNGVPQKVKLKQAKTMNSDGGC
jgi:hypothetical protein